MAGVRKPRGVDWKKDKGIFGWRRYEAYGFGGSARKDGWWWIATVKDTFDLTDFAKLYAEFWYDGTSPNPTTESRYSFPDPKDPGKVKQEDLFIEEYYP